MKVTKIARRMTRRSFRRKLIMFGASIFASLAITATGFATWVLSADVSKKDEGGIEVASVSDASISIEDINFLDKDGEDPIKNFTFEPAMNDNSGRVKADKEGNCEDMDIRIAWKVKNYQYVDSCFVEFKLPAGVYNAIQKRYLALPESFGAKMDKNGVHVTETIDNVKYYVYELSSPVITENGNTEDGLLAWNVSKTGDVMDVNFTLTLKFEWGSAFQGTNPSIYYDENATGMATDFDTMKSTLIDLKATIFSISDADKQNLMNMSASEQNAFYSNKKVSYKVVINATVK